jgi:hypothetical protein
MKQRSGRTDACGLAARTLCVLVAALAVSAASARSSLGQGSSIAGTVRYYSNAVPVPDVAVQFTGIVQTTTNTDDAGAYVFSDPGQNSCVIEPSKLGDFNGALSALDASWVLQHVVGLRSFDDHQSLACDVTGDGTISALDAARILQLVAGVRTRFPVAESCGSDWVFMPVPAPAPNQQIIAPQTAPQCSAGAIVFGALSSPVDGQDFLAMLFGDCTGNWAVPVPSATPTQTAPVVATSTDTPAPSSTPTATPIVIPTATATSPPAATATATITFTRTPTVSATPTRSATPSPTASFTRSATATRTLPPPTLTRTPSRTATQTGTATGTRTRTPTRTATNTIAPTVTRTGTRTATPTNTPTLSPTPTATCPRGITWQVSAERLISAQTGGNLWLTKTVATASGWGIFWLRQDPGATSLARLYYAHVDLAGQITAGPLLVIGIPRIAFRGHYYFAAWHQDHFGLLIANQSTLYYYNLSIDGALSGQRAVGPPLFVSAEFDQESDGDLDAFPGGFIGAIEGDCGGHSCSYAFKLNADGSPNGSVVNLVDFDFTHQFYPRAAFDGAGFAILSVKDIDISGGGVMTKYWPLTSTIGTHAKVVPAKQYLWDEFPDIAWNGDHFAALWTENSQRVDTAPWQTHFASFRRTKPSSTLIGERVIDMVAQKTNHRWTTQVHAVGADWVAQYASRTADNSIIAVYEVLGDDGQTRASVEPFLLSADALGSSPHVAPGHVGTLGIARGSNLGTQGTAVSFYTLPAPACAP